MASYGCYTVCHFPLGSIPNTNPSLSTVRFITTPSTSIFTKLPAPSTIASGTAAVSAAVKHLHPVRRLLSRCLNYTDELGRLLTLQQLLMSPRRTTMSKSTAMAKFDFAVSCNTSKALVRPYVSPRPIIFQALTYFFSSTALGEIHGPLKALEREQSFHRIFLSHSPRWRCRPHAARPHQTLANGRPPCQMVRPRRPSYGV